jgi:hypothetical protein
MENNDEELPHHLHLVDSMTYQVEEKDTDGKTIKVNAKYDGNYYCDYPATCNKRIEDVKDWEENDSKAMGNICLQLHPSIAYQLKDLPTAHDFWTDLQKKYALGARGPGNSNYMLRTL